MTAAEKILEELHKMHAEQKRKADQHAADCPKDNVGQSNLHSVARGIGRAIQVAQKYIAEERRQ